MATEPRISLRSTRSAGAILAPAFFCAVASPEGPIIAALSAVKVEYLQLQFFMTYSLFPVFPLRTPHRISHQTAVHVNACFGVRRRRAVRPLPRCMVRVLEKRLLVHLGHIPQLDGFIGASRSQCAAIGAEGYGFDIICVALQGADFFSAGHITQLDGVVGAS
jgi:hypothetical protein